jgi:hypothetical protein
MDPPSGPYRPGFLQNAQPRTPLCCVLGFHAPSLQLEGVAFSDASHSSKPTRTSQAHKIILLKVARNQHGMHNGIAV